MPRVLLTLRYDGSAYHGWQVQENGITVQQTVQDALESVLGARPDLTGCSRTDSGVHALEFCAHLELLGSVPPERLPAALNTKLPPDVAATGCRVVPDDFHARYDCLGKTYCYKIYSDKIRDPFLEKRAWRVGRTLDIDVLNSAAAKFCGEHDFIGFCSSGSKISDTVRTVSECYAVQDGGIINIHITADGFLYNMVRIIVGTLVEIQTGRIDPAKLDEIIESKDRSLAGVTAPAHGLYLEKVLYDI